MLVSRQNYPATHLLSKWLLLNQNRRRLNNHANRRAVLDKHRGCCVSQLPTPQDHWPWLCLWFKDIPSPTSHGNNNPSNSVPVSRDLCEAQNPKAEKPDPITKFPPLAPSGAVPSPGNPRRHPLGLWWSELTAENERYLRAEKGDIVTKSSSSALAGKGSERHKKKGTVGSSRTQRPI